MSSKTKKNGKTAAAKKFAKKTATIDYSKLEKDTRLISIDDWDWSRVVYSEPQKNEIPDGSGHYRRVRIQYMYDDKTIGPAIVEFGKRYCFGVQPDNTDKDGKILKDKDTGRDKPLRGYRVPIVMTSQNKNTPDATDEEQRDVDFLDDWRAEVVRYSVENKRAIGKGSKNEAQIDALVGKLLYRKENDNGDIVDGVSPKLYGKIIYYAKSKEVGTTFYGPGDKSVDPLTMTGHFYIYPTIRFDNIFVGAKISLQHLVYDATVEPVAREPKKRLARTSTLTEEEGEEDKDEDEEVDNTESKDANDMMESEEEEEEEEEEEDE